MSASAPGEQQEPEEDISGHPSLGRSTSTSSTRTSAETFRSALVSDPANAFAAARWARPARHQLDSPFQSADPESDLSEPSLHAQVRTGATGHCLVTPFLSV